jgi:hypothetical protein
MPFYYDFNKACTTNASGGTESNHFWGKTIANQETVGLSGAYVASRFGTAGGAQFRIKDNTGTVASGATAQTIRKRNFNSPAASSTWFNDGSAITSGTTLNTRVSVGFAQTGGMGGWVATEPSAKIQMLANSANPVDVEMTSVATTASVTFDATVEFSEGM